MKIIIVFGYQLRENGEPQEILLDRMLKALTEYHNAGKDVRIIFSGGNPKNECSEAWRMVDIATNPGKYGLDENLKLEKNQIIQEGLSADTIENVLNSIKGDSDKTNEVVFITSGFHVHRINEFLKIIENSFAKFIANDKKFNYRVEDDTRVKASEAAITYHQKNEVFLEVAFLSKYQPRFVHQLIKVFQQRNFEFKPVILPEKIKFEDFYDIPHESLNLSCLHVYDGSFNDEFIRSFISFLKNNEVKSLNLSGNNFGNNFTCKLINILMVNEIKVDKLNLDSNGLTDHSLCWILDLLQSEYCPLSLNLGNNKFGQKVEHIGAFKVNSRLNHLSLFGNTSITNDWLVAFLKQIQSSNIRKLDLHECLKGVEDKMKAVAVLKKFVERHHKLTYLNVADCGFTDEMMKEIHEVLPKLTTFYVYGNALTIEGVRWLSKAVEKTGSKLTSATWFGYKVPTN